jgi:hypothetical protein
MHHPIYASTNYHSRARVLRKIFDDNTFGHDVMCRLAIDALDRMTKRAFTPLLPLNIANRPKKVGNAF